MTAATARAISHPPPHLRSVTPSTASQPAATSKDSVADTEPPTSRPQSQQPSYYISDRATTLLIRRTLCSQLADKNAPISDLLPPLTSSNDVDLQLYAFIAIIIREFVHPWYAKITPDQTFVDEMIKTIAHCTRGLEQRLRKVDVESLICDELPELLDAHVRAYRIAHCPIHPSPLQADPRQIYHSLWPSPALSPVPGQNDPASVLIQKENEAAYRQLLVQGILAILLPTEDFQNASLTSLVGQILSEMILGNGVGGKACEPWVIWQGISKVAEVIQTKLPESKARTRAARSFSEDQTPDGLPSADQGKMQRHRWRVQQTFWLILQYVFFVIMTARLVIANIVTSSSLPSRMPPSRKAVERAPMTKNVQPPGSRMTASSDSAESPLKEAVLSMKVWACAANLLELDRRKPWLSGMMSLVQWIALRPGALGYTDGKLDRLLSHTLSVHVLDARLIPALLRTGRSALFPCNAIPVSTPAGSRRAIRPLPDEVVALKRHCAETLLALVPAGIQEVYFGGGGGGGGGGSIGDHSDNGYNDQHGEHKTREINSSGDGLPSAAETEADTDSDGDERENRIRQVEQSILNVFDDDYCNRHLMYGIVELICVRLMPELAERGILELVKERE